MSTAHPSQHRSWIRPSVQRLRLTPVDVILAAATLVSAVLVYSHVAPQPVHGLLAIGVLVAAPAAAMGRAFGLGDALSACVAGVAFALAVLIAISSTLLYLQRWSEGTVLMLMTDVTFGLALVSFRLRQP